MEAPGTSIFLESIDEIYEINLMEAPGTWSFESFQMETPGSF